MQEALTFFQARPENPGGRYVLLATDGLPTCGFDPRIGLAPGVGTVSQAISALEALNSAGIKNYVLGFDIGASQVNAMAQAGGTDRAFTASSPEALNQAFDAITEQVIPPSCAITLMGATMPPVTISLGETEVMMGATDGWTFNSASQEVTLHGAACEMFQMSDGMRLGIDFGCGEQDIPLI